MDATDKRAQWAKLVRDEVVKRLVSYVLDGIDIQVTEAGYWRCTCGNVNHNQMGTDPCAKCGLILDNKYQ